MISALRLLCALSALACATSASATYTKIANSGIELPDDATLGSSVSDWACTRDNDTGLIWEVKTTDGGLHDMNNTYTNYDSNFGTAEQIAAANNSVTFVNAVNTAALCGYGEWRMPSKDELLALYPTKIGSGYFPNTTSSNFWSGSPYAYGSGNAWIVNFGSGGSGFGYRSNGLSVRLVRGGQALVTFALSVEATGSGTGSINTGGVDCLRSNRATSGICTTQRGSSSVVTLTAAPAAGSSFTGWSGACSGNNLTCTLTMDEAKSVTANFSKPTPTTSLVLDPVTPTTLYASLDSEGVYASTDSGANWTAINSGLTNLNVRALAIQNSSTLYAATYDGGVFKGSLSGGNWSWVDCGTLTADTRLRSLLVDGSGNLYAGSEVGIFKGSSACNAWSAVNTGLPN